MVRCAVPTCVKKFSLPNVMSQPRARAISTLRSSFIIPLGSRLSKHLALNEISKVVNLACGLDTRFERLDNGQVRWFDLDFPSVIDLRRRFFKENERYRFIEKSVLDFTWLDEVPKDRPVFISAEGLLCFLAECQVRALLTRVAETFDNVEFAIEAISPFMAKHTDKHPSMKEQEVQFMWGVKSGREIDAWNTGFHFESERYFMLECKERALRVKLMCLFPFFGKSMKIFLLKKNKECFNLSKCQCTNI